MLVKKRRIKKFNKKYSFSAKVAQLDKWLEKHYKIKHIKLRNKQKREDVLSLNSLFLDKNKNKRKKKNFLNLSNQFINSFFYKRYVFNLNRMNEFLRLRSRPKKGKLKFKQYKSTFFRFDYYSYIKGKKNQINHSLPHLLRFSRSNKDYLYSKVNNLNFKNNKTKNNYDLIYYLNKIKTRKIYSRFISESKKIYKKDLLGYFWMWKLLTLNNNSFNKPVNIISNKFNNLSKVYFDMNNYFLIKNYFKIYKNYYIRLFRFKRNLNFKIYNRLHNKLFMRNLFWKYYKKTFFEKYQNLNKFNSGIKQLYTSSNIGVVNVVISLNNTFVTLSDLKGNVLYNAWGGILGIRGNKRSTPTASEAIARKVGLIAKEKEIKYIYLKLNGVLYIRKMKSAIKGFLTVTDLKILRVINLTPKAHNGIRRKKIKKV